MLGDLWFSVHIIKIQKRTSQRGPARRPAFLWLKCWDHALNEVLKFQTENGFIWGAKIVLAILDPP